VVSKCSCAGTVLVLYLYVFCFMRCSWLIDEDCHLLKVTMLFLRFESTAIWHGLHQFSLRSYRHNPRLCQGIQKHYIYRFNDNMTQWIVDSLINRSIDRWSSMKRTNDECVKTRISKIHYTTMYRSYVWQQTVRRYISHSERLRHEIKSPSYSYKFIVIESVTKEEWWDAGLLLHHVKPTARSLTGPATI
jgi:hypothetical protein